MTTLHNFTVTTLFLLGSLLCSCSTQKYTVPPDGLDDLQINRIAVLPVTTTTKDSPPLTVQEKANLANGSEVLTHLLTDFLPKNEIFSFITEEQMSSFNLGYSADLKSQATSIGKTLQSDAVLLLNLSRFIERDGGNYSVSHPASIAFEYRLLHTETGQSLCSGFLDETQDSLTDNILSFRRFYKRGLKWITAEQLALEGITNKLGRCRYLSPEPPGKPGTVSSTEEKPKR